MRSTAVLAVRPPGTLPAEAEGLALEKHRHVPYKEIVAARKILDDHSKWCSPRSNLSSLR